MKKYAYVQIRKPAGTGEMTDSFIILEYFDSLKDALETHQNAPYRERYVIIPMYVHPDQTPV